MAATKPLKSKLSSFAEQRARPDITGNKDKLTYKPVFSPNRHLDINTVNNGADDFIVSVKLTAT